MPIIGFIGVGNMGGGMAANLARAGHQVRAFDLNEDAVARAVAQGCTAAASARAAASGADAIITMLPAGSHVAAAYAGALFAAASPHAILIDCSTIDVATARSVGEAAAEKGLHMVDAPVSGGTAAADAGTLTFMVGGPAAAFDAARPFLETMGKAVIHAGAAGMGQAAKICNNMILGATMVATAEAFVLAEKLGLDTQTFFDISSKASGQSWSMTSYCPVPGPVPTSPANRDYAGGFATALMLKDLKLALAAATTAGASVPMGAQAEALYQLFANNGGGGSDFSAIVKLLRG
ncbi:3-hydroxyisobutyrate dehydrogenase [Polymorphobacter fuscus]|uniref:3-hydroxyisobutyrate dehydrogenase n=1 Tax=Sandarakinorhabdus fusca TaxID=1439888 RepID=A0A7C9GX41_9SPHN|nr:3-hydroxyisobutyrate dehydrogenase [Polymorphobacter fuscus]KAB7647683.1 3-hydroxyisobutyrate dehydrogenase [Polymorphobacter fuscus]MQT16974.1 3-hydroxyisobutyrate dehydrogenase [Polymorphobacter fuscus]NJC09036.1 3-hydroxyisobutyrate dehydrogenase [Polymorphobacter fuscus]